MTKTKRDGFKKYLQARAGTLRYEVSKTLADCVNKIGDEEKNLKQSILRLNGICEYCEEREASSIDHYKPLINKRKPSQYCNDYWNLIPCCKECNSSKGGRLFNEWFDSKPKSLINKNPFMKMSEDKKNKIKYKFDEYEKVFEKYHTKKIYNESEYDIIDKYINEALESIASKVYALKQNTQYI